MAITTTLIYGLPFQEPEKVISALKMLNPSLSVEEITKIVQTSSEHRFEKVKLVLVTLGESKHWFLTSPHEFFSFDPTIDWGLFDVDRASKSSPYSQISRNNFREHLRQHLRGFPEPHLFLVNWPSD